MLIIKKALYFKITFKNIYKYSQIIVYIFNCSNSNELLYNILYYIIYYYKMCDPEPQNQS